MVVECQLVLEDFSALVRTRLVDRDGMVPDHVPPHITPVFGLLSAQNTFVKFRNFAIRIRY